MSEPTSSLALDLAVAALEEIARAGCEKYNDTDCYTVLAGPEWVPCHPCLARHMLGRALAAERIKPLVVEVCYACGQGVRLYPCEEM